MAVPGERPLDLLVVGDANPDVVLSGVPSDTQFGQVERLVESAVLTVGGSAAILACGAARLGLRVGFVSVVGDDPGGRLLLDELRGRGIDTSHVDVRDDAPTGLTVALCRRDDRAILTARGGMDLLTAAAVGADQLQAARHLHLSSFYLQPALATGAAGLFAAAHEAGCTTSLDLNWDPEERWDGLYDVLPVTDLLFVNEREAAAVSGAADPSVAATVLAARGPRPVVKLGAAGALAHDGCRLVHVAAPAVPVVDTVGAGDSFDAGFLWAWLEGWDISRALAFAVVCGSLSTRAAGGVAGQPTVDETVELVREVLPPGHETPRCDA